MGDIRDTLRELRDRIQGRDVPTDGTLPDKPDRPVVDDAYVSDMPPLPDEVDTEKPETVY